MFPPLRHRFRLLQLALLALFGLGLVLQPVLAAFGEAHELAAHADTQGEALHGHTDSAPEAAQIAADTADGDERGPLHQLLHFAHCCAQSPALRAPELASVHYVASAALVPAFDDAAPPGRSPIAPYRPPIQV